MNRGKPGKELFKNMINCLAPFMLASPTPSLFRHSSQGQHLKLLLRPKRHQKYHLHLSDVHCCCLRQLSGLWITMWGNLVQKNSAVVNINGCCVNIFFDFWKIPEDCPVHLSFSSMNVLQLEGDKTSFTIFTSVMAS